MQELDMRHENFAISLAISSLTAIFLAADFLQEEIHGTISSVKRN